MNKDIVILIGMMVLLAIAAIILVVKYNSNWKKLDNSRAAALESIYSLLVNKNITEHIEQSSKTKNIFLDHYSGDKIDEIYVVNYLPVRQEYEIHVYRGAWDDKTKKRKAKLFVSLFAKEPEDIISFLEMKYKE